MVKKYCVIGAGGSFGLHTCMYLIDNTDAEVIGIGRNFLREPAFSLDIQKKDRFRYLARHTTYELDLLLEFLDEEKPEIIINYAAQGEGAVSWKNSWRFFETNSMGLARFAEELNNRSWLKHFIQIGTSEMYGSVNRAVKEDEPIKPTSPYAASKVAFDMYLLSISKFLNFPMSIIRPSNCYCPGQLLHRIIPKAIWCGLTKNKLPLHGGGKAEKSYLHARDLARAIHLVSSSNPNGEIYNVGPENPTSIKEVVERCANALNLKIDDIAEISEDRLGQDSRYWLDSNKISNEFGWKQEIFWDEGLQEMVEWGEKYLDDIKNLETGYILRG